MCKVELNASGRKEDQRVKKCPLLWRFSGGLPQSFPCFMSFPVVPEVEEIDAPSKLL